MITDDVKVQTLLVELEETFLDSDDEMWIPRYKQVLGPDRVDPQMDYAGAVCVEGSRNTEYHYIVEVGQIEDEDRAKKICAAINAIPQLLDYIRQLEASIERKG